MVKFIIGSSRVQILSPSNSELKKKGTLPLDASVRAVAVGEEEETRREREEAEASFEALIL